jgi:hypothetical protein
VREVVASGRWLAHYDGWPRSWDETVGPERIVAWTATPPGPLAHQPDQGAGLFVVVAFLIAALLVAVWIALTR